MSTLKTIGRSKDRYLSLIRAFPLRPIRTARAHEEAKRTLRSLGSVSGQDVSDYKSVLLSLIVAYESTSSHRFDTSKVTASEIVKQLLQERSMSVNAFAKEVDIAQSALSDMLNGKREWSKSAILRVAEYFSLEPGIFLR